MFSCACVNWYNAGEEETVTVSFVGEVGMYSIEWSELLATDETPIISRDELFEGMEVLAPYETGDGRVSHSRATVSFKTEGTLCQILLCLWIT